MNNPWKGLDSYKEKEKIYGRDEETEVLFSRIEYNVQTVVYGRSGIGKSSIINAGIFPKARRAGMMPVSIRLIHTTDTENPSDPYLAQIRRAIESELAQSGGKAEQLVEQCGTHEETLWEYLHRYRFFGADGMVLKPLLVFDQFEEIFTLEKDRQRVYDFFSQMGDLLNEVRPPYLEQSERTTQQPLPTAAGGSIFGNIKGRMRKKGPEYLEESLFHIVFTLREDYLSYLERSTAHIPSLKLNRYSLQPINEEQAAEIIMKPVPGLVDKGVAELIIQKVTGEANVTIDGIPTLQVDSAILSLYLSRLYLKCSETGGKITRELVDRFSDNIIQDFYMESIAGLPDSIVEYLEDNLLNNDGRRENISVYNAMHVGHLSEQQLDLLASERKLLRRFAYGGDMRIEYIHDILCPVVQERRDYRSMLKRQEAERNKLLMEEKKKREEMEEKARREKEEMERQAQRLKRKNRRRLVAAASAAILLFLLWAGYALLYLASYSDSYGSFTWKNGWPVGVGKKLDGDEKKQMVVYYRLTREGIFKPGTLQRTEFTKVEVMNAKGKHTTNKFVASPLVALYESEGDDMKARSFALMQQKVARWEYTADNKGDLTRETAYDIDGNELYGIQFFRSGNQNIVDGQDVETTAAGDMQLWANYTDSEGKAMRVRDNGADRMRLTMKNGFITGYAFFSESGTPQQNGNRGQGVYGYRYEVNEDGCITKKVPVDVFNDDISSQAVSYTAFDEYGRWTKSSEGTARYDAKMVVYNMGAQCDTLRFDNGGRLVSRSAMTAGSRYQIYSYNDAQELNVRKDFTKKNGQWQLEESMETFFDQKTGKKQKVVTFNNDAPMKYKAEVYDYQGQKTIVTYYEGSTAEKIDQPSEKDDRKGGYHRLVKETATEKDMQKETLTYYDKDGKPCENREFFRQETFYNADQYPVRRVLYNSGGIYKTVLYEYDENGKMVAQSAMGVDNTPIRCPQWEMQGFSYYKLKFIQNFTGSNVAVKAINEFGDETWVVYSDDNYSYVREVVPSKEFFHQDSEEVYVRAVPIYQESLKRIEHKNAVTYIHILNKEGTYYKATSTVAGGLRDGDLLLENHQAGENTAGKVVVARPNPKANNFLVLTFNVAAGSRGAETYPVYYTYEEMRRLESSIGKKK